MPHENKNQILSLFYHEGTYREQKKIRKHVQTCDSCQEYLHELKRTEFALNKLKEEKPLPNTLDMILENIPSVQPKLAKQKKVLPVLPFIHISSSILFILSLLYIIHNKFSVSSLWQSLEKYAVLQSIGSFGVIIFVFFCIGTFITLALFPTLFFDSQKQENIHRII